jgi:uncharacterized protein YprB with RNaseH-like and TPR domain
MSELLLRASNDPHRLLFLDIETAGTWQQPYTTVIGWAMGGGYFHSIKSSALDAFSGALAEAGSVVTFNGKQFDVPFLLKEFPDLVFPRAHIDLMYDLRSLGLRGGQKAIELELGLSRPEDLGDLRSHDAPRLWREYGQTKDKKHLETLIRYNREDVLNMVQLLAHVLDQKQYDSSKLLDLYQDNISKDEQIDWS